MRHTCQAAPISNRPLSHPSGVGNLKMVISPAMAYNAGKASYSRWGRLNRIKMIVLKMNPVPHWMGCDVSFQNIHLGRKINQIHTIYYIIFIS